MGHYHDKHFPNESDAYRAARDKLLAAEIDLRRQSTAVTALRRSLPVGGIANQDYLFDEAGGEPGMVKKTRLSEMFADGKDSLVLYSFMFAPGDTAPCPACTSLLDSLDGGARHIMDRINLAVVAKAPVASIQAWAAQRGWRNLRLLSSGATRYNADYFGETPDGAQLPNINVFQKIGAHIHHTYSTEILFAPTEEAQHPRHADAIWPLWNMFDLTPTGRGTDWGPKIAYP